MIREFATIREMSSAAAGHITDISRNAVATKGFCTIVLAGGSTPRTTYELLGGNGDREEIPLQQCHFFWGDERWVEPTHPDSNFAMARESFLNRAHIPPQNIIQYPQKTTDLKSAPRGMKNIYGIFFTPWSRLR